MDCYHLPLPIMNGYFKQVTPPKAISDLESGEYLLNKFTEFKKNGCKIFSIEYDPVDNHRMAPVWDLFINLGEMDCILGLRVKVQVIPPQEERDPNSIMKQCRYCKHHINYSSKVCYSQHKTVINLNHPVYTCNAWRLLPTPRHLYLASWIFWSEIFIRWQHHSWCICTVWICNPWPLCRYHLHGVKQGGKIYSYQDCSLSIGLVVLALGGKRVYSGLHC